MLTLYELARGLAGQANTTDTADVITKHLRRLVPFSLCVFFAHDVSTDELVARHAAGDVGADVRGMRIQLGQRLSGWVASNRQTIINSDPALDFGDVARTSTPRLRSCLSTPLLVGADWSGIESLYSNAADGFTDDHRRVIEMVAKHIAHAFHEAGEFDTVTKRDALTGLPSLPQLEQLLSGSNGDVPSAGDSRASFFVDVMGLGDIVANRGRIAGDDAVQHVVRETRSSLRMTDILFRCGAGEFEVPAERHGPALANVMAARISDSIRLRDVTGRNGEPFRVEVIVRVTRTPSDGHTLRQLRSTVETRSARMERRPGSSVH